MINQPLLDFIKLQLSKGLTKEKIESDLLVNGWTAEDVREGFSAITPRASIPTPPISVTTPVVSTIASSQTSASVNPPTQIYPQMGSFIPPSYGDSVSLNTKPAKTHPVRNTFLIILLLFLLAGGASAYYFKDNLVNLPIVKNILAKKDTTAVEAPAANTNQVQTLPVQNTGAETTPINSNLPETTTSASISTPTPTPAQFPLQKVLTPSLAVKDCGSVSSISIFGKSSAADDANYSCFIPVASLCNPVKLNLTGLDSGSINFTRKNGNYCEITLASQTQGAYNCKLSMNDLSAYAKPLGNFPNYSNPKEDTYRARVYALFLMIGSTIGGNKTTDLLTGKQADINCVKN